MAVSLHAYLNFPAGVSREAMTYYQEVFGGEATFSTFADYGMTDVPGMPGDATMHSQLVTGDFTIMAADAMPGSEDQWGGTRIYLAFMGDDEQRLRAWFDRLGADGTVGHPLTTQVWGDTFGDVKDKYGVEWLFNISGSA